VKTAVAIVFNKNFYKSKKETTSNWSVTQLTEKQLLYAANDAWAAIQVFLELNKDLTKTKIQSILLKYAHFTQERKGVRTSFTSGTAGRQRPMA
jgi:ribonuclease D